MAERIYGHCRACHLACPAYWNVEGDRIVSIEPVPFEEGGTNIICARGIATVQLQYSPTRVRYPMKRAGKRGEGKWQRISWDQATTEIAEKIHELSEKYGPETFVLPGRTGRQDMGWIASRFARTIGTPNNYYGPIQQCLLPQMLTMVNFGSMLSQNIGGSPGTKLIVAIGIECGYSDSFLSFVQMMGENHGCKVISLDPVCGPYASRAHEWLPIRPGTDLAYFMTIIRHLLETGTYDYKFVTEESNAAFLVRPDTGALLTEADVAAGGSDQRYLFWDEASGSLKWWDKDEVQWEGGESGRAHYEKCVEQFDQMIAPKELSTAKMPENVKPALFGEYEIAVGKHGRKLACKPAMQLLWEAVADMTYERCSEITGIDAAQIERTCTEIGNTWPVAFYEGFQYQSTNASQLMYAMNICKILKGSIDVPGGVDLAQFYPVTPQAIPGEFDISYADGLALSQKRKRLGYYEHRIGCGPAWEEICEWHPIRPEGVDGSLNFPDVECVLRAAETGVPYEVHGIIAISSDWLMHDPSTARWMKLIEDEDAIQLHVVSELVMSPTAELADYVLPAVTWMERNYLAFAGNGFSTKKDAYRKVVEPICEAKHDYDIFAAISKKLDEIDPKYNHDRLLNPDGTLYWAGERGALWEADTIDEERDRWFRECCGTTWEDVLEDRKHVYPPEAISEGARRWEIPGKWPTGTGKAELFSTLYQHWGYQTAPVYTEPAESPVSQPKKAEEYPLVLSTGKRQVGFFHSEFRQIPWAREINPVPEVFINPKTAAKYGIEHGDWVWVESSPDCGRAPYNRIMGQASFRLPCIENYVSYSQHGWWRPEKAADDDMHGALEWNAECLLESVHGSPECGTTGLRSQLCKVYKASAEDIEKYHPMITRDELEAMMPLTREAM